MSHPSCQDPVVLRLEGISLTVPLDQKVGENLKRSSVEHQKISLNTSGNGLCISHQNGSKKKNIYIYIKPYNLVVCD